MSEQPVSSLVLLTADQLHSIVQNAVRAALADFRPRASDDGPQVFDYAAAARFCDLSESTLRRAVRDGDLRPVKTGCRAVRFCRAELTRWQSASESVVS